jgi:hypothetical protein
VRSARCLESRFVDLNRTIEELEKGEQVLLEGLVGNRIVEAQEEELKGGENVTAGGERSAEGERGLEIGEVRV